MHGKIKLGQNVKISAGTKIGCSPEGTLYIGRDSSINVNSQVICMQNIRIGKGTIVSWDDLIMDSDFHHISDGARWKDVSKPINIGDNVWIGCRATILKGSNIPDGCIVAAGSVMAQDFAEKNCLLTTKGVVKRGIFWRR